jgi:hypothetical protein
MHFRAAVALAIGVAMNGMAPEAVAQPSGGFGGVRGGGPRPTGGSNLGYNRAGTASSGGFAYGDAPRMPPKTVVDQGPAAQGLPCSATPVSVDGVPYYKCSGLWYTAALTSTGISYVKVAPPPGY